MISRAAVVFVGMDMLRHRVVCSHFVAREEVPYPKMACDPDGELYVECEVLV